MIIIDLFTTKKNIKMLWRNLAFDTYTTLENIYTINNSSAFSIQGKMNIRTL